MTDLDDKARRHRLSKDGATQMTEQASPDFAAQAHEDIKNFEVCLGKSCAQAHPYCSCRRRIAKIREQAFAQGRESRGNEIASLRVIDDLRVQLATVTAERDEAQRVLAAYRKYLFPTTLQRDEARARAERLAEALREARPIVKDAADYGGNIPNSREQAALEIVDAALSDQPASETTSRRVRHKKRGTTYRVIGEAILQATPNAPDNEALVLYQSEKDGQVWARPASEFEDGRFEDIGPGADSASATGAAQTIRSLTKALEQIERGKVSLARDELIEFMRDMARAALAEVRDRDNG